MKKILVVIDTRPSNLTKTDSDNAKATYVGAGVVLREEERHGKTVLKAHNETLDFLKDYAKQHSIPIQPYKGGGRTEAGRAMEVLDKDAGLNVVWLQPPIGYEHTPFEVMTISDLMYTLQLTEALSSFEPSE